MVSAVDKDPKTGKMTTTTHDKNGKVTGTKVTDIPKEINKMRQCSRRGRSRKTS